MRMKPEKIIKYLEMVRPTENYSHTFSVSVGNTRHFGPGSQLNKDVSTAIDLAIQSLKKQVPKKPIICGENPDGTYQFKCSECGRLWWEKSYITKYCDKCGNLIDRSESDE